jgi:2-methylcitrate dehydratase PrpD
MAPRLEVRPDTIPGAIAAWVDGFSLDGVPTPIVEEARKAMINTAGTGLGGFHIEETRQAVSLAKSEEAGGPATIAVDGAKVSAQTAAFVNGLMFSALGQEDTHPESGSHPSETLLSALLAAAEVGEISGVRALEAQIIGLEVTAHVGSGSFLPEIKWERGVSASVFGAVGAAAALGKCFGLDRRGLQDAMVLAANLASGLMEGLMVSGTPEFHWSVARTPVNGYLAARLAQHGAYASPTSFCGKGGFYQVFLGVEPEAMDEPEIAAGLTAGLGSDWKLGEMIYKPWAVHFPILPYIDGARILRERHDLDPATVTEIAIEVDPGAASLGSMKLGPYENREEILGVAPFVVAGMLARGRLGLRDLESVDAPDIMGLVAKTTVREVGEEVGPVVTVTAGGRRYTYVHREEGRSYELDRAEIESIYRQAMAYVEDRIPTAQADELLRRLASLEAESSLADLVPLMVAP